MMLRRNDRQETRVSGIHEITLYTIKFIRGNLNKRPIAIRLGSRITL